MNPDLPTGTVTFLFTDIEGSTRLWQQHPEAMKSALACHHAVLNETITAHRGYVFQIIGDAFCAAFSTAMDGLEAALAAQRLLRDATWGETGAIRVRMALHTGAADVRIGEHTSGEYVSGLTLSRTARLLSCGHGEQILLSLPTSELVRDQLPPETILRDLGAHRLKDLIRPEHIFQVVVPDLPSEFLPLKTLDTHPNNLPIQFSSFIGREKEMVRVKEILNGTRLLTLTGAGGSGKTRLAIQVAAELIDEFPAGVWFVEFAPLSDPTLVPHVVAAALGLQPQSGRTIQLALTEYLGDRNCLLLLDNCEHLIDTVARLADELMRSCPNLKILATSREGFGITGECIYHVPSLTIPSLGTPNAQTLTQYEAVRLFIDRAMTIQPDFVVTNQNAPALAQICYYLDGIPLAIELAAARVNFLSVEQISERLVDCFRLLTGGRRTALPRHQTLRALIDWSYSLLSPAERILFERLSIFAGGWTLEAAESICAGSGIEGFEVLDLLQNLAAKSLVVVGECDEGQVRFRLLETIRRYALEILDNSGRLKEFRYRHLDWYLDFAEQASQKLFSGEQAVILNRLEAEHDNFNAALAWSMETEIEKGLRLAAGLDRFWIIRGYWFEQLDWLKKLLAQTGAIASTLSRAKALGLRGDSELNQGEFADAEKSYLESLQVYKQLGDENGIAGSLDDLASHLIHQGDFLRAGEIVKESLDISRKTGNKQQILIALLDLADSLRSQGDLTRANELLEESLSLFLQMVENGSIQKFNESFAARNLYSTLAENELDQGNFESARKFFEDGLAYLRKTEDPHEIAWFMRYLANLSRRLGDLARAESLYQESLQIVQGLKDKHCIAHTLGGLAQVEYGKGNYEPAASLARQALFLYEQVVSKQRIAIAQSILGLIVLHTDLSEAEQMLKSALKVNYKLHNNYGIAESLAALSKFFAIIGAFERAARLLAAALALRESLSFVMTPFEISETDRDLNSLHSKLGAEAFNPAWEEGRGMTLEQAVELALADFPVGESSVRG